MPTAGTGPMSSEFSHWCRCMSSDVYKYRTSDIRCEMEGPSRCCRCRSSDVWCRSGEDDRLAEHGVAADERGPDVGPHAGHGRVAGVVPHVHLATELPLLVLDSVARALKYFYAWKYFYTQKRLFMLSVLTVFMLSVLNIFYLHQIFFGLPRNIFTWETRLHAVWTHWRMKFCSWAHCRMLG